MYDKNNVFSKIIRGDIPSKKVYEDDKVLAFYDIAPAAPIHVLVIPKGEYQNFNEFAGKASGEEVKYFFSKVSEIAEKLATESNYRLITNIGSDAGQSVFHFHVHIIGGKKLEGLI
ncbi:MAG: histidine triad nucleotide-binding protein [Rickettsiaceae bacterium]|jgi:diadenosine tetraphosphate (Ap4A) HIT family hydrolase|nr:histidine triad nucleotide-binding protein [Rickettsiaceae bacterium]